MNEHILLSTIDLKLKSLVCNTQRELQDLKTLLLASTEFEPLRFTFNKTENLENLTGNEEGHQPNVCRWSRDFKTKEVLVKVVSPEAIKIVMQLKKVFNQMGIETVFTSLPSKIVTGDDSMSVAHINRALLFKPNHCRDYFQLESTNDRVVYINQKIRAMLKDELRLHGASDEIISKLNLVSLSAKPDELELMLDDKRNGIFYKPTQSLCKAKRGNGGVIRHGFKRLTISLPFEVHSKSMQIGYLRNFGFGSISTVREYHAN